MKFKMAADQVLKRFARQIRKEDAFSPTHFLAHCRGEPPQDARQGHSRRAAALLCFKYSPTTGLSEAHHLATATGRRGRI
jgi:hypothetical protein